MGSIGFDKRLLGILAVALALRAFVLSGSTYIWDEDTQWIPIVQSISFVPGEVHLPAPEKNTSNVTGSLTERPAGAKIDDVNSIESDPIEIPLKVNGVRLYRIGAGGLVWRLV